MQDYQTELNLMTHLTKAISLLQTMKANKIILIDFKKPIEINQNGLKTHSS